MADVLPESRLCDYCLTIGQKNNMSLSFLNPMQAIYICNSCDEVYPNNGVPIKTDVNSQPLNESDLKQIGLPVQLLSHFPIIKLDFANKIIKASNNRWRLKLNNLWQDFMCLNNKINLEGGVSRKMDFKKSTCFLNSENSDRFLFDVSSIDGDELKEIDHVLDLIEKKATVDESREKAVEIRSIGTDDFFNEYKDDSVDISDGKCKRQVYMNKRKDMNMEYSNLRNLEQNMLLKNVKLKSAVFYSKYPKLCDKLVQGVQRGMHKTKSRPTRITKETLSKMLEASKF